MARKPRWSALSLLLVLAVFTTGTAEPVAPVEAPATRTAASDETTDPRPVPDTPYPGWDGQTGVGEPLNMQLRWLVQENAEESEDFEVRDAATAALAENTNAAFQRFLLTDRPAAVALATARRAETAQRNRTAIEAMAGTGGPIFNAEVQRVLAGTDYDREIFLLYGKDIATDRDERAGRTAAARAEAMRARVTVLAGSGGPEVRQAAQDALTAGDAAIAAFLDGGYLAAARLDADAHEAYLRDLEERTRAAERLSELARRAARANEARGHLLVANGQGIRAVQRGANAMVSASNAARQATQILAANEASGQHSPESFTVVRDEVDRQLGYARDAAVDAHNASVAARAQADILVSLELPYGADWARLAEGMAAATQAASLASETAQQAIVATMATDAALDEQAKALARAEQASRWRAHAEEHARATAALAEAARLHAVAGQQAAARARQGREDAESAAWFAQYYTDEARHDWEIAEAERVRAAECRATAERERAQAEHYRLLAEEQAVAARNARGEAERQAAIAAEAEARARAQERVSEEALGGALAQERAAELARNEAIAAERDKDIAEARAQALEQAAILAKGTEHEAAAHEAARQARIEANTAATAAVRARDAANVATGAAARAREYATLAEGAAVRAQAAAEQARAHAANADWAATDAEEEAAKTRAASSRANAAAATATAAEVAAAKHAAESAQLAQRAVDQAVTTALGAERTRAEADAAADEAVSAATQSGIAGRAALGARASSAAIIEPANTAITVLAPFTGAELGADWVAEVAREALAVGDEHADAAQRRATEAQAAAVTAQEAADRAQADVKPVYQAAADAAAAAADAQQYAANAQRSAADAAADAARARDAAATATRLDAEAHDYATRARAAANAANEDAAIAGHTADSATAAATAARAAADQAELDAIAATDAAERAERSAAEAQAAADRAQSNADAATEAMNRARQSAIETQQALDRLEQEQRQAEAAQRQRLADSVAACVPGFTAEDVELMESTDESRAALAEYQALVQSCANGGSVTEFLVGIGAEVLLEVVGWRDLERCFGHGDIAACLWSVVNVASWATLVVKLPRVAAAIVKVVTNIGAYLAKSELIRNLIAKVTRIINALRRVCPVSAPSAAAWISPCQLLTNQASPEEIAAELATARRLGVSPTVVGTPEFDALVQSGVRIKWAVLKDGSLRVMPATKDGEEIAHTVLANGDQVASAGTCTITGSASSGYQPGVLDLNSGHYVPPRLGGTLERKYWEIGRNAFLDYGILFSRHGSMATAGGR